MPKIPLILVKRFSYICFFFCCISAAFFGCVNDPPPDTPKQLTLGDSSVSNTIVVPVGGGTFYFNSADTSNSVRIVFPSNSYSAAKSVTLSVTKITGSSLGDNITPVSSLFTIDAGSDFSNKDIIVNIPVFLDTSKFSMAFFYDKITHELEGVPTIGYFINKNKTKPNLFTVTLRRSGSIFISSISHLAQSVSSAYDPKQDNWEFPNYATSITAGGQFAGQSLSAAWYYYEKALKGSPHLYGTFDADRGGESPKLWEDNDLGLRVAAETQQNLNWNKTAPAMIAPLTNGNASLTLNQLIYSMMVTGKPQLITVVKDTSVIPLLVYKIVNEQMYVADPNYPTEGNHAITKSLNVFRTGLSMHDLKANGGRTFQFATYIGVRAMVDWDAIGKIWTDAQSSIFTSFPPPVISFTDAKGALIKSADGFITLFDKVNISIQGVLPSILRIYQDGAFTPYDPSNIISLKQGANQIGIYGQTLSTDKTDTLWTCFKSFNIQQQAFIITLATDSALVDNDLTLRAFMGQKPTESLRYEWDMGDGSTVIRNTDIDSLKYRYKKTGTFTPTLSIFTVNSNKLIGKEKSSIVVSLNPVLLAPSKMKGITGTEYIFYGNINLPKDVVHRCEWNMGDGSSLRSIKGNDTNKYTYKNPGTYTVELKIFDFSSDVLVGICQGNIEIMLRSELPTLAQLQGMRFVNIEFVAKNLYKHTITGSDITMAYDSSSIGLVGGATSDSSTAKIIWQGLTCKSSYHNSSSYDNFSVDRTSESFGSTSENNTISLNFSTDLFQLSVSGSYSYSSSSSTHYFSPNRGGSDQSSDRNASFDCKKVYLKSYSADSIVYLIQGADIQSLVSNISKGKGSSIRGWPSVGSGGPSGESVNYFSTLWTDPINTPTVKVSFRK